MKKTRTPFKTPAPTISEAQLAMIRHTAKRYLIAGGSITIAADGAGDREEFIGNTRHALNPRDGRLETRSVLRIFGRGGQRSGSNCGPMACGTAPSPWPLSRDRKLVSASTRSATSAATNK